MTEPPDLDEPMFFIMGTGRCGSTLLQAMLARHPRICIPPETHFFPKFDPVVLGLPDPLPDDAVDRYVSACTSEPHWAALALREDSLRRALDGGTRSARGLFLWMLRSLAGDDPGPRFGEKTPYHAEYWRRVVDVVPDARIVHIYRDPRDVVASIRTMPWRREKSALLNARRCRLTYDRLDEARAHLAPDRFHEVRYETLIEEPQRVLTDVCAFLDEEFSPSMLEPATGDERAVLPGEEQWKARSVGALDAATVARFRDDLTAHEIWTVERVVGAHMDRMGYERAASGPHPVWASADALVGAGAALRHVWRGATGRVARLLNP